MPASELDNPNLLRNQLQKSLEVKTDEANGARVTSICFGEYQILQPNWNSEYSNFEWGSFFMAPWCNREVAGPRTVLEKQIDLQINCDDGTAIHGLVHSNLWKKTSHGFKVDLNCKNFPWPFSVESKITVTESTFRLNLSLTNKSIESMPAGIGWHPWFNAADGDMQIEVFAKSEYEFNSRYEASSAAKPVESPTGRHQPQWGSHRLFTDLTTQNVSLFWPKQKLQANLAFSDELDHLLIYAKQNSRSIAIEPQSHAPNGFDRLNHSEPGAVKVLSPGESLDVWYELSIFESRD